MARKWASTLHRISAIAGILGVVVVIGWWIVLLRLNGFSLLFEPDHMYKDATILLLISIAFGIGALIHHYEERGLKK
jgi:hypothetical protein